MTKKYQRLSLAEWQRMFEMKYRGYSIQQISKDLKRDRRGVASAIERYPLPWHHKERGALYCAKHSYEQAERRRGAPRKRLRLKNRFVQRYVEEKLQIGWTPELIAGRLRLEHPEHKTNHESIYAWIFSERPELKKYLFRVNKPKRGKPGGRAFPRRQPAAPKRSIESRPLVVNDRARIGDKESDLIVSSKSETCLLVVVDRMTRETKIKKVPNRLSETVNAAQLAMFKATPKKFLHTFTQDNGSEHALHRELEEGLEIEVYFCHPYSACERGTVENRNGFIRRYHPKGTDFSRVTDQQIQQLEDLMNSRPMAVLNFLTPREFHEREEQNLLRKEAA